MNSNPAIQDAKGSFFKTPNQLVDEYMVQIEPIDTCILLLILRQTIGWHKTRDAISYSQFIKKTGINSRTTISKSIKRLEEKNLIKITKSNNHTSLYEFCDARVLMVEEISLLVNSETKEKNKDNCKQWTSPDTGLVHNLNQSTNWTSSSPISGPETTESGSFNGHTKERVKEKKETSSSMNLKKHLKSIDSRLIFSSEFYAKANLYIENNDLDYSYCDWLYKKLISNKKVDSITGYYYSLFFEENQKDLFLNCKIEKAQNIIKFLCPICNQVSSSTSYCSNCSSDLNDLTENKILREKAFYNMSKKKSKEYSDLYAQLVRLHPIGPEYKRGLLMLDEQFGIPNNKENRKSL